jgi:archaellum component FlaG (FlaF/FlaG flagellin family)
VIRRVIRVLTLSLPLVTLGGIALSDSKNAAALADSLESQFQLVNDPTDPAVIGLFDEALQAYSFSCKRA